MNKKRFENWLLENSTITADEQEQFKKREGWVKDSADERCKDYE
jgi:hypothetical protein